MFDPGDLQPARDNAGGEHHMVEMGQYPCLNVLAEFERYAGDLKASLEITQCFAKFFLAGNAPRDVELPADHRCGIEQGHLMAAFGSGCGAGHAGRARADDGDFLWRVCLDVQQLGFVAGTRIDQAGSELAVENVVEARLIAGDAGVDLIATASRRFVDEFCIGEERARHRHHVSAAGRDHVLCHFRRIDAVGCDQRNLHLPHQAPGDPRESSARHHRGDRRDARLVPADARVDQRCAGGFDGLSQRHNFVPGAAPLNKIEHRQAKNDDEIFPASRAHRAYRFNRKAAAVFKAAAPVITAEIGLQCDELVDQIAFRAHHLDAVVTGELRQFRAVRVIGDGAQNVGFAHFAWAGRRNRCLHVRWRDGAAMIGVAAGVQNLQGDLAALPVHGIRDLAMLPGVRCILQRRCAGHHHALLIRANPPGHNQPDTAARPLGVKGGKAGKAPGRFFKAGVH